MCAWSGRPSAWPSMSAIAARTCSDHRIRSRSTVLPAWTTSTARTWPVVYVQCTVPDTATPGTNTSRRSTNVVRFPPEYDHRPPRRPTPVPS